MMQGRFKALAFAIVATSALPAIFGADEAGAAGQIKEEYYGPSHGTPLGDPPDADIDLVPETKHDKRYQGYQSSEYNGAEYYDYGGSIKDGYDTYDPPPRYRRKRVERRYNYRQCVHPRDIRHGLRADGWVDLTHYGEDDGLIFLRGCRRDSDRVYRLELDKCSGLIVSAKPVRRRGYRSNRWIRDRW
ncbi:MAG: hypothetical protein ACRBCJ_00325 [Hyphomicrobiaceae bacterium]